MTLALLPLELGAAPTILPRGAHTDVSSWVDLPAPALARRDDAEPIELSVIVPAHNEELRLPSTLAAIRQNLEARAERCELIVVDDGSTDGTSDVASRAGANVIRLDSNMGKGAAVRVGVLAARGRFVLTSDADLSTPIGEYESLRRAIDLGASVAIASRALEESRVIEPQPFQRRAMGRVFNRLVRALVLPGVHDTQCGFKLFRADMARAAFGASRVDGFAFDVEILAIVNSMGGAIAEVPVEWRDSPNSTVRPFSDVPRMLLELVRIRRDVTRRSMGTVRA